MTAEGRLIRGKANYEAKAFLKNSETLEYLESLKKEEPKVEETKSKGKK